jgi:hypothetical protein
MNNCQRLQMVSAPRSYFSRKNVQTIACAKVCDGSQTSSPGLPMGTKERQKKRESVFRPPHRPYGPVLVPRFGDPIQCLKVMHCTQIYRPVCAVPARGGSRYTCPGPGGPERGPGGQLCCILLVADIPLCSKYINRITECVLRLTQL